MNICKMLSTRIIVLSLAVGARPGLAQHNPLVLGTLDTPQSSGSGNGIGKKPTYFVYWPLSYSETAAVKATALVSPSPKPENAQSTSTNGDGVANKAESPKRFDGLGQIITGLYPNVSSYLQNNLIVLQSTDEAQIIGATKFLALTVDIPQPQVKLRAWAIELSKLVGKSAKNAGQLELVSEDIRQAISETRALVNLYNMEFVASIRSSRPCDAINNSNILQSFVPCLEKLGFKKDDPTRDTSIWNDFMTFSQSLLFLGLTDRSEFHRTFRKSTCDLRADSRFRSLLNSLLASNSDGSKLRLQFAKDIDAEVQKHPQSAIALLLQKQYEGRDARHIVEFVRSYTGDPVTSTNQPANSSTKSMQIDKSAVSGLRQFSQGSATLASQRFDEEIQRITRKVQVSRIVDIMLKNVMDAYQADLERIFYRPLRKYIIARTSDANSTHVGVSVLGDLSISASNRETGAVSINGTMQAPYTAPMDLSSFLGKDDDGTSPQSGGRGLLEPFWGASNVSPQAAFLLGSLLKRGTPTYSAIGPGVSLSFEPSIFADAGGASLSIDLNYGVSVTAPSANTKGGVYDTIQSANTKTKLEISANDLFELSTSSMTVALPADRANFLFVPGKRRLETRQQSVLILTTVSILPRAQDFLSRVLSSQ